jgi:hypothetical protein
LTGEEDRDEHEDDQDSIPAQSQATQNVSASPRVVHGERIQPHIVHYGRGAGQPVSSEAPSQDTYATRLAETAGGTSMYEPFSSRLEWEIARWAKFQVNLSASAVTELLSINGVCLLVGVLLSIFAATMA